MFLNQLRDVKAVGSKFYHVLYPKEKSSLLKECKLRETSKVISVKFLRVLL